MKVVAHYSEGENFDAEDTGQKLKAIANPQPAVIKVLTGNSIVSTKKPTSNTAIHAVNNLNISFR